MATEVILPRQGNTVESCIINEWKKKEGETVSEKEVLCVVETDKATFEIESPVSGTLLKLLFKEGDDVPVMTVIAVVGQAGEKVDLAVPQPEVPVSEKKKESPGGSENRISQPIPLQSQPQSQGGEGSVPGGSISPRAKNLAERKGIDTANLVGSGPEGRIIERDIITASQSVSLTPAAMRTLERGLFPPADGTGLGGRVRMTDMIQEKVKSTAQTSVDLPVKGIRKVISQRMMASLQGTAQLTLHSSADATAMNGLRAKLKLSSDSELQKVTLNDFILFAVAQVLLKFPEMNAHFLGETMRQFHSVNLGFAVDTPRGLMVPVIRNAHLLPLLGISKESKRLAKACQEGSITPEELSGGTFTITNLGALGIESFTPVLNAPEVGILGICSPVLRPIQDSGQVRFAPFMGLSLTFNHQALDGAPAARFLKEISETLKDMDLFLAGMK